MLTERGHFTEGRGTDSFISSISTCAKILHEEYPEIFTSSWLDSLLPKRKNEEGDPTGEAFTLNQISLIKKYTLELGNDIEIFIFYKLFREGDTKLEDLQSGGKNDFVGDVNFIDEANKYFRKITRYLKKETHKKTARINSAHFKLSHKAYFFYCPYCQLYIENVKENWILVQTDYYDEYRLVHAACKEKVK